MIPSDEQLRVHGDSETCGCKESTIWHRYFTKEPVETLYGLTVQNEVVWRKMLGGKTPTPWFQYDIDWSDPRHPYQKAESA